MTRAVIVIAVVISLSHAPAAGAGSSERDATVWSLAKILEGAERRSALEQLSSGLAHPDPVVRGVAARVTHAIFLKEASGPVMRALESESDASVARELMRSAAALEPAGAWEAIFACAERTGSGLRETALLLLARSQGAESIPRYLELESRLSASSSLRILTLATREDRAALERVAGELLEKGREQAWTAALRLLMSGKSVPPASLLAAALRSGSARIRQDTAAKLILMAERKNETLTPEVLSALDAPIGPGGEAVAPEEAFERELLRRMGGGEPITRDEWLDVLRQPESCFLDRMGMAEAVESYLTGKERKAAHRRWEDQGRRIVPPDPAARMPSDLPRTLGDLPAGFSEAVVEEAGCRAPERAALSVAEITWQRSGRPASVRTIRTPSQSECLRSFSLMLRAALAPDDLPIDPSASTTLVLPFAVAAVKRLDELPPAESPIFIEEGVEPPKRLVFVKPEYPEELRKLRTEGRVILEMSVDRLGVPGSIRVLKLNRIELALSAILAVSQWRYRPATRSGASVPVMLTVIVDFNLATR